MIGDVDCPPSSLVTGLPAPGSPTILSLAAELASATDDYRHAVDAGMSYSDTVARCSRIARASEALVTAIVDTVATGDNRLS